MRPSQYRYEWLFFIDHDVILPPTTLLKLIDYINEHKIPIVSGLYFTRSVPAEPLIYRGRGNSYYRGWKFGDKVWVDGHGMGCCLIHVSVLEAMPEESEEYALGNLRLRRVFETPAKHEFDPEGLGWITLTGTEDLYFLDRLRDLDILSKAGWKQVARRRWPYLVDTSIYCIHMDFDGVQYPARGEHM